MARTKIVYNDLAPEAATDATFTSSDKSAESTMTLAIDSATPNYLTLELNHCILGAAHQVMGGVNFWSAEMSGSNARFTNAPVIDVAFTSNYTSTGISFIFDETSGDYCDDVTIAWYQDSTLLDEQDFAPDAATYFCQNTVENYNRLVITLNGTNLPSRYAKINQIMFGAVRVFTVNDLESVTVTNQIDILSKTLPVSTAQFTFSSTDAEEYLFQFKQPFTVYSGERLVGTYYVNESDSSDNSSPIQGGKRYNVSAQDAVGVLDKQIFGGGAYLAGVSAKTLLQTVVNGAFDLEFDASATDTTLYGLLMPQTTRNAMQKVLFAWGMCAATDGTNKIRVFAPSASTATVKDGSVVYKGGKVKQSPLLTSATVRAYTYTESPSGSVELNGVKYDVVETDYTVTNANVTPSTLETAVSVTDCTLISTSNGQAAAQRVYDYYLRRNRWIGSFVWDGELNDDTVSLLVAPASSMYLTGEVVSMTLTLSNTVAANAQVLEVLPS